MQMSEAIKTSLVREDHYSGSVFLLRSDELSAPDVTLSPPDGVSAGQKAKTKITGYADAIGSLSLSGGVCRG